MRTLTRQLHRAAVRGVGAAYLAARVVTRRRGAALVPGVLALVSLGTAGWAWTSWWVMVGALVVLVRWADDRTGEADVSDGGDPSTDRCVQRLRLAAEAHRSPDHAAGEGRRGVATIERARAAATGDHLPLGQRADGGTWRLPLAANTLIAGEPGTGTSTLVRAILARAKPLARDRPVRLWVADSSGGAQVPDVPWYAASAFGGPRDIVRVLDSARAEVAARQRDARLRGDRRHRRAASSEPLVVLVVDDVSTLLAGAAAERHDDRGRIVRALHKVLAEGPAVGVVAVTVFKDVDDTVVRWRHLYRNRVALRLADRAATDGALGPGARDLGAACDRIPPPPAGAGVAFAWWYGEVAPVPVRIDGEGPQARSA